MDGLLVKLEFDIDRIFDEEFQDRLNDIIRHAVIDEMNILIRQTTIKICKEHEMDVSEIVLEQYKAEHAKFEASLKGDNNGQS